MSPAASCDRPHKYYNTECFYLVSYPALTSYDRDQKFWLPAVHIASLQFHLETLDFMKGRSFPTSGKFICL